MNRGKYLMIGLVIGMVLGALLMGMMLPADAQTICPVGCVPVTAVYFTVEPAATFDLATPVPTLDYWQTVK